MRKIYITLFAALLTVTQGFAGQEHGGVQIHDSQIEKKNENVTVTFRATVDRRTVRRSHWLVFAPVLTDGTYSWSLPAIVVRGKGSRIVEDRHIMASGRNVILNDAYHTVNGGSVDYRAEIPYQLWMDGADLVMEAVNIGCCSSNELTRKNMATDIVLSPPVSEPEPVRPQTIIEIVDLSTGDKLAQSYNFIQPLAEYEEILPGQIYDEDRENALTVNFQQGKDVIIREFGNNKQSLIDLMSSIRIIENSIDSRVKHVVIAGFASPEGSFELNDRLAWSRAVSVKEYIIEHSGLAPDMIQIYNGSEDWRGLRSLVERSNMYEKQQILDIIDNVPIWDSRANQGRLGELMRLNGGEPYRYIYKHFFPQLRNAAYIKIYYENK